MGQGSLLPTTALLYELYVTVSKHVMGTTEAKERSTITITFNKYITLMTH